MKAKVIFIMGVSGSGKSTIGRLLAQQLRIPFFDADDYHTAANVSKMQAGIPLDDADRYSWLKQMHSIASDCAKQKGGVIACSALKQYYRELLTDGINQQVKWIFLEGGYDLIKERMLKRTAHFMPAELLTSQLNTLEIPSYALRISIDAAPEKIVEHIMKALEY
jgi:carbohydrate kinase (thermoresistant glucokinase family)